MNVKTKSMKKCLDRLFNGPTPASVVDDIINQAFGRLGMGLDSIVGWYQAEHEGKLRHYHNDYRFDDGDIGSDYSIYLFPDKITILIEFDDEMNDQELALMRQSAKRAFGRCVEQYDPDVFITCRIFIRPRKLIQHLSYDTKYIDESNKG
ncbi:hypothetical protein Goslar_00071 [Escherichia phage vB_EcoM_Goslar]|uniref:Uncharacterized protein n=1 Tax=Escherichia phage vB_EcoM_Goslar TaxID=2502409 RepID=A0A482GE82_BPGOS|nr:hypothetical protein HOV27_gp071 [Escherichia phage vB_EcoM_Goslar]QBO63864.1 hypothetical protein Goslar_00071 [Escherichia phage vB_EcoM_Goslar]